MGTIEEEMIGVFAIGTTTTRRLFYNIQNNDAPRYLCDLIPPTIQSTTVYPLRNGSDIIIPFCRLSNTYDSFIPSTIRQWTSLDPSIREGVVVTVMMCAIVLLVNY
jgi:hypothetical protein